MRKIRKNRCISGFRILAYILFTMIFVGCEKDNTENENYTESVLAGTWLEQTNEDPARITFTDNEVSSEIYVKEFGTFLTYEEATYTSTVEKNIVTLNAEIIKMNMIMIGGKNNYVKFPYTDDESGITYKSISEIISFVVDTLANNSIVALIPTVRPYSTEACFGGDTETLLGEWHSALTRIRVLEMDVEGSSQQKTLTINFGNSFVIDSDAIQYTWEEMNCETGVSEVITETAVWEPGSDNTFLVVGEENNLKLISGTYRYMVVGNGISISFPQEINGVAEYPAYFKKQLY